MCNSLGVDVKPLQTEMRPIGRYLLVTNDFS